MKVALLKDPEVVRRIEQPLRLAAVAAARVPARVTAEPDPTSVTPPVTDATTGVAIPQPPAPPDLPANPPQDFEH
jgi:hypothetical protein